MADLLGAFFTEQIKKFASMFFQYLLDFIRCGGVDDLLEEWDGTLQSNLDVLEDAEKKQFTHKGVRRWLDDFHDLAYDIDDFKDELPTEDQARLINRSRASTSGFPNCIPAASLINNCGINPAAFMFNLKMKPKIDDISSRLQDISQRRGTLGLIQSNNSAQEMVVTVSTLNYLIRPSHVISREKEKKEIVDMLENPKTDSTNVPVITIIGMGGLGKTTLAQDIYHDENVVKCFDLKAWVCVSEVFDVAIITRAILKQILPADNTEQLELPDLQVKLKETLSRKTFLVVLDDIWNEDYRKWENLLLPFPSGAAAVGSRILATTRNESVALTMSPTGPRYHLKELGEGDSLSLLALIALERNDFEENTDRKDLKDLKDLKEIGKQIVKKCGHLPLAIKMVASLLRTKERRKQTWEDVVNNNNWIEESGDILPALEVSYYHLPSHLKRCFAYCAIIPKDFIFDKNELVLLWMAEGFLEKPAGESSRRMEDFGRDCFEELLSRSFFQLTGESESKFIMHDLINDLAVHVAGERCFQMDNAWDENQEYTISKKTRHLSFISRNYEVSKKFNIFNTAHRSHTFLHTFLALLPNKFNSDMFEPTFDIPNTILAHMLSRLQSLRVLNLENCDIVELPNAIGALKHLRYLNLSYTNIKKLPQFVCSLYNLQTLLMNYCCYLRELPSRISCLTNLRHLGLEITLSLEKMPSGIGKLTSLQSLSKIIVGKGKGSCNLKDLEGLKHLHGALSIEELWNVTDVQDAVAADLRSREQLENVRLEWQYSSDSANSSRDRPLEKRVLEKLEPHGNLKELVIKGYGGIEFPSWVGGQSMSKVVKIYLQRCSEITHLPPLGKLPLLKDLVINSLNSITSVGVEFYGGCAEEIAFPSLETLTFFDMGKCKEWSAPVAGKGLFPHLRDLTIFNCRQLEKLPKGLHGLASLQEMSIRDCPSLVWDATDRLPESLIKLKLSNCPKSVLSNWGIHRLTSLQTLEMWWFEDVVSFEQVVGDSNGGGASTSTSYFFPASLTRLEISNFPNLESLSNSLQNLTSLRELDIYSCPKLESYQIRSKTSPLFESLLSLNAESWNP